MGKEVVWTSFGVDGAGAYLLLRWLRKTNLEVHVTTPRRFRDDFIKWQIESGTTNYSKIFIVNLDLSKNIDVADLPNVVVIDSHKSHTNRKDLYSAARTAIAETTSTTRLIYKIFSSELIKHITPAQVKLISMIDDHMAKTKKFKSSSLLNAVYWTNAGDKLQKFVDVFDGGYTGLTPLQKNSVTFYYKRLHQQLCSLSVYQGFINSHRTVSTFAENSLDEVAQHLIEKHQAQIAVVVNIKTSSVFFHRARGYTIPLAKIAEELCDGGGNDSFAGGVITEKFLEFTKTLQQIC